MAKAIVGVIGGSGVYHLSGLTDVREETRKVVTPSRKEVQATTSVVLVAVFLFGFFFMVTDFIFNRALHQILTKLGGAQ